MHAPSDRDFAGYRIVRPLELGERASVWEAEHLDSGGIMAIETLAGDAAKDEDVRDWFAEAWEAVAEIAHPNVVSVEEVGEQDGVPFAVRTPANTATLARRIGIRGPLEPEAAVELLTQIGDALEAAHEAGVVHGALAPSSVIVEDGDGAPRALLGGFGRAEGDRREDVRDLGAILAAMLGERAEAVDDAELPAEAEEDEAAGEADADPQDGSPDEQRLALKEVVRTSTEDGYRTPSELVAAAQVAAFGRSDAASDGETGSEGRAARSPVLRALTVLALVGVVVLAVVILSDNGDDGTGSSGTGATTTTASSTFSSTQSTTTGTGNVPTFTPPPIAVQGFPVGVSARESTVYAVTRESGELSGFDQGSGERTLGPVDLGGGAEDVTVVYGVVWASLPDSDAVARVTLGSTDPPVETIDVGSRPSGLIGALGSIWVVDEGSAELSQVPLDGGSVTSTPLDTKDPRGIAFGLGSLWVSDADGHVLRIDPTDPSSQESFDAGAGARGVLVVDDHVWVADTDAGTVTEIDPASGESRAIEVGGSPRELAADPTRLWVSNGDGFVTSIELDSDGMQQIDLNGAGGSPQGVAVGSQVWTTTGAGNSLVAVAPGE